MRDLWIKDDDLIVATHGRSFWILDDIAPLREIAAGVANSAHLFGPATAYRIQRDTYTDTPMPPDEPMGANPPNGAILDYFLPSTAKSVTVEIVDGKGQVVRRYANTDKPEATEEELRQQLIPLYWVRTPHPLSTQTGMHRWVWDLHYTVPDSMRHDYPISAVPHDTPRYPLGPNALPGNYTVRLSVDGKTSTAPLTVKMDPRVKTSPAGLQKKFETEAHLASIMSESTQALHQGASIRSQLDKLTEKGNASVKTSAPEFEKKLNALLGSTGGFFAPPSPEVSLSRLNGQASGLYQQVWNVDAEPTTAQLQAGGIIDHDREDVMRRWNEFKQTDLPAMNRLLRQANIPEINPQAAIQQDEPPGDEE
jgi:hypothetical protein